MIDRLGKGYFGNFHIWIACHFRCHKTTIHTDGYLSSFYEDENIIMTRQSRMVDLHGRLIPKIGRLVVQSVVYLALTLSFEIFNCIIVYCSMANYFNGKTPSAPLIHRFEPKSISSTALKLGII